MSYIKIKIERNECQTGHGTFDGRQRRTKCGRKIDKFKRCHNKNAENVLGGRNKGPARKPQISSEMIEKFEKRRT